MDLLSLVQALWRYKLTSLLVLSLTGMAVAGVLVWTPPVYTASASLLLIEPPEPSTDAKSPVAPENPFVRYADNSVIITVVARRVQQEQVREEIVGQGGVETYEVDLSRRFGGSSPIIDIAATADSQSRALSTVHLVIAQTTTDLYNVQAEENVRTEYMYTARTVEQPASAVRVVSGTLRKAIGVLGLGLGCLVLALASRRAWDERHGPSGPPRLVAGSIVEVLTPRGSSKSDAASSRGRRRS